MSNQPEPRFVDPRLLARAAMALLALGVLFDATWVIRLLAGHEAPEIAIQVEGGWLHFWARAVTAFLFLMWIDRVYGNLPALGQQTDHQRVWATLAFVVPPLMVFRPYQVVDETWRRSGGDDRSSFSRIALAWWIAFLIPPLILISTLTRGRLVPEEKWLPMLLADIFNVIAGVLAIRVVHEITEKQRQASRRVRRDTVVEVTQLKRAATLEKVEPRTVNIFHPAPVGPVAIAPQPAPRPKPKRRRTLEQRIETVPPRIWKYTVVTAALLSALALGAAGLTLVGRGEVGPAIAHTGFALMIAASAIFVAKQSVATGEGRRWMALAAAGVALTVMNLLAVAEAIIG